MHNKKKPNYNGMSNNLRIFRLSADTLTKITLKLHHALIIRIKHLKIILFFKVVCTPVCGYPTALFELVFISVRSFPFFVLSFFLCVFLSHAIKSNSLIFFNGQAFVCVCVCVCDYCSIHAQ